jgi:nitrite reductase/ring-hydroxylating ferredoxin subunit
MIYHRLEALANLHDDELRVFSVAGLSILLIQRDGQLFAIENKCGHFGIPLENGTLEGRSIRCRQHGAQFDLATGAVLNRVVAQCDPLRVFEVRRDGGDVGVML